MTEAGISKGQKKRIKRARGKYRWTPPMVVSLFLAFVAAEVAHYFWRSWPWAFGLGFATYIAIMVTSVFYALANLDAELDILWWALFGGLNDPERQLDTLLRYCDSGAVNDLKSGLDTLIRSLEEKIRRESQH